MDTVETYSHVQSQFGWLDKSLKKHVTDAFILSENKKPLEAKISEVHNTASGNHFWAHLNDYYHPYAFGVMVEGTVKWSTEWHESFLDYNSEYKPFFSALKNRNPSAYLELYCVALGEEVNLNDPSTAKALAVLGYAILYKNGGWTAIYNLDGPYPMSYKLYSHLIEFVTGSKPTRRYYYSNDDN
jgi:hypothetical protein